MFGCFKAGFTMVSNDNARPTVDGVFPFGAVGVVEVVPEPVPFASVGADCCGAELAGLWALDPPVLVWLLLVSDVVGALVSTVAGAEGVVWTDVLEVFVVVVCVVAAVAVGLVGFTGLIGLTGLATFVGLVTLFTQVFVVVVHEPHTGLP